MRYVTFLFALMLMTATTANAQNVINLWPDGAPERSSDPNDRAELHVFLPDQKKATGRAIVMCPGGAYRGLAFQHEGTDWAGYFNQQGIALFVLKYRLPHGNREVPISDAEQAMRMVRANARTWRLKTDQLGICGFSAGGHLASTIATQSKGDAKPDFQILFYPVITMEPGFTHQETMTNFLGSSPRKKLVQDFSSDRLVSRATPRAFIALSDDDRSVPPANGVNYYMELYRNDVPASLYVYPTGGHGWGSKMGFKHHLEMQLNLQAWLNSF